MVPEGRHGNLPKDDIFILELLQTNWVKLDYSENT